MKRAIDREWEIGVCDVGDGKNIQEILACQSE